MLKAQIITFLFTDWDDIIILHYVTCQILLNCDNVDFDKNLNIFDKIISTKAIKSSMDGENVFKDA